MKRRRGQVLEAALLTAAWDELAAVGYAKLTMEGVAVRAKTSRPVISRRWPSRPELVLAALRHHSPDLDPEATDTGTLREDVLSLLRNLSARAGEIAGILGCVIADYLTETGQPLDALHERALAGMPPTMQVILQRAVRRGEIAPGRLTPRIASLPVDLVRHDLLMTQTPVPDETLLEIVDKIFLPLGTHPRATG